MKRLTLLLTLILTLTMAAAAQNPPTPQPQQPPAQQAAEPKNVEVEFVSHDATAKTITVRQEGRDVTLPVDADAAAQLANFKAGDKVTVTVREDGGKQFVSAVKKSEKAEKPKP